VGAAWLPAGALETPGGGSEALAHKCFWASYPSDHVWTLREVLLFRVPSWPQPQVC